MDNAASGMGPASVSAEHRPGELGVAPEEFAAMSVDARTWYIYRRQNKVFGMASTLFGVDPATTEIGWADQQELAALVKDARDRRRAKIARHEGRLTTLTTLLRSLVGGLAVAGALKLITLVWDSRLVSALLGGS